MKMKDTLPFVAMVVGQVTHVGFTLTTKKAIETGMDNFSYIFYSNALASILLLPAVLFIHRSPNRLALTFSVTVSFLLLGILGLLAQVVGYAGVTYASTTEATAIVNLIPEFTFVLAVIFRLERVDHGGWAKVSGTLVSLIGALIVTFYAGTAIIKSRLTSVSPQLLLGPSSDRILGGVLMLINSVIAALFIILEALILQKYSAVLILALAYCSITSVLSLLASLILEHDLSAFSLQSKTRLLSIMYAGFFGAGFHTTIGVWCVKLKGPFFVAMFQPLGIVIAAIMGVIFLGDDLYLGCLIGSTVIAIGFYGVMWGKAKEDKIVEDGSSNTPLLQDDIEEDNLVQP